MAIEKSRYFNFSPFYITQSKKFCRTYRFALFEQQSLFLLIKHVSTHPDKRANGVLFDCLSTVSVRCPNSLKRLNNVLLCDAPEPLILQLFLQLLRQFASNQLHNLEDAV